jgi:ribosome recycling factor
METKQIITEANQEFEKAINFLKQEFSSIQAGKASPSMLENIKVSAYGDFSPLKNLASINTPELQSLTVEVWDKSLISSVEKAIRESNLDLNPLNDGSIIRINLPPLTEERRKQLVKVVNQKEEEAKITVRQIRQDFLQQIKKLENISEDLIKNLEEELQEKVQETNKNIEDLRKNKEKDIMTI